MFIALPHAQHRPVRFLQRHCLEAHGIPGQALRQQREIRLDHGADFGIPAGGLVIDHHHNRHPVRGNLDAAGDHAV